MRWLTIACGVLWFAAAHPAMPQSTRPSDLAVGKLLVASPDLPDPNFARSVVLLIQFDDDGVVGLIVNRRSQVPISKLLDKLAAAKGRSDAVYAGGPVGQTQILALMRARKQPGDAKRIAGDIFLMSGKDELEQALGAAIASDRVRVYLGYAGWTAPQLENELELGAWFIFEGNAGSVFDADPGSLWPRLIRETEVRVAGLAQR